MPMFCKRTLDTWVLVNQVYLKLRTIELQELRSGHLVHGELGNVLLEAHVDEQLAHLVRAPRKHLKALRFDVLSPEFIFC